MSFRQTWNKVPSRIRDQFSNGNLEFVIGGSLLTFAGYAYWEEQQRQNQMMRIQPSDASKSGALRNDLRKKYLESLKEEERVRKEMIDKYKTSSVLFQCEVMVAFPLDGQKGLQGAELGDILDVLEEGVGPDGSYNLCRFSGDKVKHGFHAGQIGLYPARCLKKLDASRMNKPGWRWWRQS